MLPAIIALTYCLTAELSDPMSYAVTAEDYVIACSEVRYAQVQHPEPEVYENIENTEDYLND